MEKTVLTTDELQSLKNFQTTRGQIVNDFGVIEFQIQELKTVCPCEVLKVKADGIIRFW